MSPSLIVKRTSDSTIKTVDSTSSEAKARAIDAKALEQLKSLSGHPGKLTSSEAEALERFRTLVTDAGLYTPASTGDAGVERRASHSEATLWYALFFSYRFVFSLMHVRSSCFIR